VDAVVATTSYAEFHRVTKTLTRLHFRQIPGETMHVHRWRSPENVPFDLVPAGVHLGASGNWLDEVTAETAETAELEAGLTIRHASAPAFLALKWAAHNDRGVAQPRESHDLEDLLALLASRPGIEHEVSTAPARLGQYIAIQARAFLDDSAHEDLLAAHLNNAQNAAHTVQVVKETLEVLAARQ
jgi:predicted nucleotidyltransferase